MHIHIPHSVFMSGSYKADKIWSHRTDRKDSIRMISIRTEQIIYSMEFLTNSYTICINKVYQNIEIRIIE